MKMQNMKRSETTEQINLFQWAERTKSLLPELDLMYHVPNEGKRTNGGILKAAGLKNGVPDVCLPVSHNGFHGLYIELKYGRNKATKAQEDYMALLNEQNYKTAMCYGFEEAKKTILEYLSEPGKMPKERCIQAPWINGKCDGIFGPSRMFATKECIYCERHAPNKAEKILKDFMGAANMELGKGIASTILFLSSGKTIEHCSMEDTLEVVNKNLELLVKCNDITLEQSAAVLSIAMEAYEVGKKEREKHEQQKERGSSTRRENGTL